MSPKDRIPAIPHSFPQNQQEKQALEQLRSICSTKYPEESRKKELWDDFYYLRWLRARDLIIPKSLEMLDQHLIWKKENAEIFKKIQNYTPPQLLLEKLVVKFTGTDEIGRPVVFQLVGRWETRKLIESGYRDDVFCYLYHFLEQTSQRINKIRQVNPAVTQVVSVLDMDELNWWKVGSVEIVQLLIKFFKEFEANYPEILKDVYVLNAHWIFQYIFAMVKPILSAKTLGKVHVFSKDRSTWERVLKDNIPMDAIPVEYGGRGEKIMLVTNQR